MYEEKQWCGPENNSMKFTVFYIVNAIKMGALYIKLYNVGT